MFNANFLRLQKSHLSEGISELLKPMGTVSQPGTEH